MLYVKFRMVELGMSSRDAASLTGVAYNTIAAIVRGRTNPTEEEKVALAKALKCRPEQLLVHVDAKPLGEGAEYFHEERERKAAK